MTDALGRLSAAVSDRYRIEREIGSGGMATVYLAEDLKHHRKVAVKVLRPELAVVLGAERFLKEIEVTAHLQHPHVLPLFDSGEADSFLYYVMPFVEGESLRQKLNREKQLSVEEALRITEQVASALDYAHRHEVIHRDIKPENILLHDGQALVADFGIALAVRAAAGDRLTETGLSLGTPQYMSPEQATADRELDARSDVYSLACVLYEMLAGEAPYTGPTAQAVIAKVISGKPERITALRDTVPVHVEAAIHKAMAKLPADRFGTAAEFASALTDRSFALRGVGVEAQPPVTGAVQFAQRLGWLTVLAAGLVGLVAGAGLMRLIGAQAAPSVVRFVARLPEGTRLPHTEGTTLAVSPDGQHLVYVGEDDQGVRLFIKRVSELHATPIEGTEGARTPFFSPDGRWIGFASGGQLKRTPLGGGPVQTIASGTSNWGADWGADGSIVYSSALGLGRVDTDGVVHTSAPGLRRVSADGGEVEQVTRVPEAGYIDHLWPEIVPSGDAVLFTIHDWRRGLRGAQVAVVVLETGEVRQLIPGAFSPRLLSTGHLLFSRADGTVEAVRFDASGLELIGQPAPVVEGVQVEPAGETDLAISQDGSVVYLPGSATNRRLMRVDRSGRATPLVDSRAFFEHPAWSPDGRRIAVRVFEPAGLNIWAYDVTRGGGVRVTSSGVAGEPTWTPDGQHVSVALPEATGRSGLDLYRANVDGSGAVDLLLAWPGIQEGGSWTPDGRQMVFASDNEGTGWDLMVLTLGDSVSVRPLLQSPANELTPKLSPDGDWVAYVSNQTGRYEVYVRGLGPGTRQWLVSSDGGLEPLWGSSGSELFYRQSGEVLRVTFRDAEGEAYLGLPEVMFEDLYISMRVEHHWDIDPSGQWFVVVERIHALDQFVTVLNWFEELADLVGR